MAEYSVKADFSKDDIEQMGNLLKDHYGAKAAEIADLLMYQHAESDDLARANAWGEVAQLLTEEDNCPPTLH